MRFKDKVVIVSGGGSIGESMSNGRAASIQFAREGAKIVVIDRNFGSAEETVKLIKDEGGEAIAVEADVTEEADVQSAVEKALSAFGKIDILFNNVGFGWGLDIINTAEHLWKRTFDVCLHSVFLVSKYVIPEMRKTGGGAIINNASTAAFSHDAMWAYNTSKAAVVKLTKDMAYDYGRYNIRVNCVAPGLIDSALGRFRTSDTRSRFGDNEGKARAAREEEAARTVPLGRQGTPEEVANAVLFLASNDASYINGVCLIVDGGGSCR